MKRVVLLGDGMADDPIAERGGRTPLELAYCPNLSRIAEAGWMGQVRTVPEGMEPGSDVANMAILGYNPRKYYTGRAAIEAAAVGIQLGPDETAFRMNLVTLEGSDSDPVMADYSGGHPSVEEQQAILETLQSELGEERIRFVPGVSFRNLCIISGFEGRPSLKPPHDYAGEKISRLLPSGPGAELLTDLIQRSRRLLADHPVNRRRAARNRPPINAVWFWGMGKSISLPSFYERHGIHGAVVTAVDLIRGLARLVGLEVIEVPGATGYVDTNYEGKAAAVIEALKRVDFVFLHVEAPDEAGHEGNLALKIKAIEDFDRRAVGPILAGLRQFEDYRVMALPDHETPVKERRHRGGLVPCAVASADQLARPLFGFRTFCEKSAAAFGAEPVEGPLLLETRLFS